MLHMTEPVPGHPAFGGLAPLLSTPLPLIPTNPDYKTVRQKLITNCPLMALLAALAHAMPKRLREMVSMEKLASPRMAHFQKVRPLPDYPATLTPKPGPRAPTDPGIEIDTIIKVKFPRKMVEISPRLYLESNSFVPRFGAATDGTGWVSYIEKAYVVFRAENLYRNLDLFGKTTTPLGVGRVIDDIAFDFDRFDLKTRELWRDPEFVSPNPPVKDDPRTTIIPNDNFQVDDEDKQIESFRRRGFKKRLSTVLAEHKMKATVATTDDHTLAVVDFKRVQKVAMVTLFDPMRGVDLRAITLADFVARHDAVYQVR
jgi:hypothetical protein